MRLEEIKQSSSHVKDQSVLTILVRPLGPYTAWAALKCGIAPLAVSYFNFFFGLFICLLFALVCPAYRVYAALLLILWQIADVTDGSMARAIKLRSNYGGFIDHLGGMFLIAFLPISIGLGLYQYPDHSLQRLLDAMKMDVQVSPTFFLIICGLSSIALVLSRLTDGVVKIRFRKHFEKDTSVPSKPSLPYVIVSNIEHLGGLQIILLVLCAAASQVECYAVFYFLVNLGVLFLFTLKQMISLRNMHVY